MSVTGPTASPFAGIVKLTAPFVIAVALDVYKVDPPERVAVSVTVPVGAGRVPEGVRVTVTPSAWLTWMEVDAG